MILVMFIHCLSKNDISMKSVYISIKSVSKAYIIEHYQFSRTKNNRFEGQNMGGGIKDMLSPPMSKHGGDTSPPSPRDLRPCSGAPISKLSVKLYSSGAPFFKLTVKIYDWGAPISKCRVKMYSSGVPFSKFSVKYMAQGPPFPRLA